MGCTRSRGSRGFQCLVCLPRPGEPGRYPAKADTMNPYDSPRTQALSSVAVPRRLDRVVLLIGILILCGFLASIVGLISPAVREFLVPRFGRMGLFLGLNSLIFIGFWAVKPMRRTLLAASFITCAIGAINGLTLMQTGTVDAVQNVFHDRIHSAWIWSVIPHFLAGSYLACAAFHTQGDSQKQDAG